MSNKIYIKLDIGDIKDFCDMCGKYIGDIDVSPVDTRYVIDAKSIMGMYSINCSNKLCVTIHTDVEAEIVRFNTEFKKYEV